MMNHRQYLFSMHVSFQAAWCLCSYGLNSKGKILDTRRRLLRLFFHLKTARRCLCISQLEGKVCSSVCMSVYAQRKCDWYSDTYFKHPFKSQFQYILVYCSRYFTNFVSCTQFLIAKIPLLKLNYCNKTKQEFFLPSLRFYIQTSESCEKVR